MCTNAITHKSLEHETRNNKRAVHHTAFPSARQLSDYIAL